MSDSEKELQDQIAQLRILTSLSARIDELKESQAMTLTSLWALRQHLWAIDDATRHNPPQIEKIRMEARWVIGVPKGATDRILSN